MKHFHLSHTLTIIIIHQICIEVTKGQRISIQNNGYSEIKVFFPEEESTNNKYQVIKAAEDLFRLTSIALYSSTKRRTYFSSVTFVLPKSWGPPQEFLPNKTVAQMTMDYFKEADLEITDEIAGTNPFTLHIGGCGEEAVRIYLPMQFLMSEDDMEFKSKLLLHHWAQFRYGIFPEGGFQSDDRYPLYFSVPGTEDVEITSCGYVPFNYTTIYSDGFACEPHVDADTGRPQGSQCTNAFPTEDFMIQSSLMYQQGLPKMSHFCHGDSDVNKSHNNAAPSKHNILCGEESTWFVILRNKDFINGRNQPLKRRVFGNTSISTALNTPPSTTFKYVQQSSLRVILALETSAHMKINSRYQHARNALAKFILYDLPSSTKFGLVSFSGANASKISPLIPLETKESRLEFLESDPFDEEPGPGFDTCVTCALEESLQLLQTDDSLGEGGMIILITTGNCENLAKETTEKLLAGLIRVFVVSFSENQSSNDSCLESLSSVTGGGVHHITELVSSNTMLTLLYLSLGEIVKGYAMPTIQEVLIVEEISSDVTDVSLPFFVGDAVDTELKVIITGSSFDSRSSPLVPDATRVRCGNSSTFAEFQRLHLIPAWVFEISGHGGSNCVLETKRKDGIFDNILVVITEKWENRVTAISTYAALNFDQTVTQTVKTPLKLYGNIHAGIHPIVDAKVVVSVYHPNGDISEILLIDDGIGDPDVTMNDGIYSSYFSNYSTVGYYTFIFGISARETTGKLEVDASNCCGSFMPYKSITEVPEFTRIAGPVTIFLKEQLPQEDIFPPNQILDLRVFHVNLTMREYTLKWTAAGNDYNRGMASKYKIKVFPDRIQLRHDFDNSGVEIDWQRDVLRHTDPSEYGALQECVIRLPDPVHTGTYYIGIRAIDDAHNRGLVSNTVPIFVFNDIKEEKPICDNSENNHGCKCTTSVVVLLSLVLLLCMLPL